MATRLYLANSGTISAGFVPSDNPDTLTYNYWDVSAITKLPFVSAAGSDTKSTLTASVPVADGNHNTVRAIYCTNTVAAPFTLNVGSSGVIKCQIRLQSANIQGYYEAVLFRYRAGVYQQCAYGNGTVNNTTLRNRTLAINYDASDISVLAGDRLVLYLTGANDSGGASTVLFRVGANSGNADLPEDNASTSDLNPWFEFSETITFSTDLGGATKTMFSSSTRRYRR